MSVKGIGAYNVEDVGKDPISIQSVGPTEDGRVKPDILAPSFTETATLGGTTALGIHPNTSGAVGYAGAAAMLLRAYLEEDGQDLGTVYSFLILSGRNAQPFLTAEGAGPIFLRSCGVYWYGDFEITETGEIIEIGIDVKSPQGQGGLAAALWWPESSTQAHNDIDLAILN